MFKDVMKKYKEIKPIGRINDLETVIADSFSVKPENAHESLYGLMGKVLESSASKNQPLMYLPVM